MRRTHLTEVLGLGLCLTLGVACGADGTTSASATETGGTTQATEPVDGTTTTDGGTVGATMGQPTTGDAGSGTEGGTGTTAAPGTTTVEMTGTTADVTATEPPGTSTSTSTGEPDTTTTGSTTDASGSTTEVGGSTTEDDTSSTTSEPDTTTGGVDPACEAPAEQPPCDQGTDDVFKAIGLNCSDDLSKAIPIKNPVLMADSQTYRVATRFGSAKDPVDPNLWAWGPREGERFLVMGTGTFPALNAEGALLEGNGQDSQGNANPDGLLQLPGIMNLDQGSNNGLGGTPFMNCDGVNDCSDTIEPQWNLGAADANDVFYMSFDLVVPQGTNGYLLDFVYFSEEWPNFVGSSFNDMMIVWSTSETFTGNVTFIEGQPLTVTALDPYMSIQPGDPLLAGTGFPGDGEGASTGWFTAKGSAKPGEDLTIAITIFDMGDSSWDTVGIVDKFRWDCVGCIPSEVNSCGIVPL